MSPARRGALATASASGDVVVLHALAIEPNAYEHSRYACSPPATPRSRWRIHMPDAALLAGGQGAPEPAPRGGDGHMRHLPGGQVALDAEHTHAVGGQLDGGQFALEADRPGDNFLEVAVSTAEGCRR
jgi:hypothetical protein